VSITEPDFIESPSFVDAARFTGRGPRGSVYQRLYVEGALCGVAYSCVDEVSGEVESK
jgi:hypothetical protein